MATSGTPAIFHKSWGWDTLRRMPAVWWSCVVPKSWLKLLQGRSCKSTWGVQFFAAGLGSRTWLPGVLLWPTHEQPDDQFGEMTRSFFVRLFPYYVLWVFSCIYLPFCFPYTIPCFPFPHVYILSDSPKCSFIKILFSPSLLDNIPHL